MLRYAIKIYDELSAIYHYIFQTIIKRIILKTDRIMLLYIYIYIQAKSVLVVLFLNISM